MRQNYTCNSGAALSSNNYKEYFTGSSNWWYWCYLICIFIQEHLESKSNSAQESDGENSNILREWFHGAFTLLVVSWFWSWWGCWLGCDNAEYDVLHSLFTRSSKFTIKISTLVCIQNVFMSAYEIEYYTRKDKYKAWHRVSEKDRQLRGQNGTHYYPYHKIAEKNTAKSAEHGNTEQNSNSQVSKCIKLGKKKTKWNWIRKR